MRCVGQDQLTIGVPNIACELFASSCGIDADDGRSRERGAHQQEQVLRDVLEERTDVERAGRTGSIEHGRTSLRFFDDVGPRPRAALETKARVVVVRARATTRSATVRDCSSSTLVPTGGNLLRSCNGSRVAVCSFGRSHESEQSNVCRGMDEITAFLAALDRSGPTHPVGVRDGRPTTCSRTSWRALRRCSG